MQLFAGGGLSRVYKRPLSEITAVETSEIFPSEFQLLQNYPNPFNPSTKIKFVIPKSSLVNLKVYDVLGNEIATLVNEEKPAGNYKVTFDASSLPSGVYFYKIKAGKFEGTKKLVLLR
jgi:Secretion system C-terminal sorting domain